MFALFANGAPAPFPQAASSASEWAVWGGCMSGAAVLGGWALLNRNRPARDTLVGVALLVALILVGAAAFFSMAESHYRQMEENRQREQLEQR